MEPILLVLTNLPDREAARKLAEGLVGARLGRLCKRDVGMHVDLSLERRDRDRLGGAGADQDSRRAIPDVEDFIRGHHPYELPEVIALPLNTGLASYLAVGR